MPTRDQTCNNRPSECKKLLIFLDLFYHNSKTIYINTTKSSSLLQNLVGFLLQLTEMRYYIWNGR